MSPFAPGLLRRVRPRSVALLRASRIGDFVCATPAFRAIRAAVPGARITLVGLPLVADLAARCASLDAFEPFPGMPGIAEQFFEAGRASAFFARMRAARFDVVIQMHGSGVYSNPAALMFGARYTAGFVRPQDGPGGLDSAFPVPEGLSEIGRLLALAGFLGAAPQGERTDFPMFEEDGRAAEQVLGGLCGPLVGIQPGAREATKRWPPERFAEVATALARRHRASVVVLGGPDDVRLTRAVTRDVRAPAVAALGAVPLPVLGAVIRRLAVLVTNDSGPAHIAYALGTPTVTIFGGSEPRRWRPATDGPFRFLAREVDCRPCDHAVCPLGDLCLRGVTVEEVVEQASAVLRGG